jgi:hypothetical protein
MAGLINTGLGYQNSAMSGFIRESADEAKRDQYNKQLALAQKNQNLTMLSQAAGIGASVYSGTNLGGGAAVGAAETAPEIIMTGEDSALFEAFAGMLMAE